MHRHRHGRGHRRRHIDVRVHVHVHIHTVYIYIYIHSIYTYYIYIYICIYIYTYMYILHTPYSQLYVGGSHHGLYVPVRDVLMFFSPRCCQPPHWNGKSLLNLCETRGTVLPCASFALIASSTCPSCRLRRSVDWDGVCYQMWVIWPAELWDFTNEYDIMDSGCLQIREKKHVIAVVKGKWYIWPLKTLKKIAAFHILVL